MTVLLQILGLLYMASLCDAGSCFCDYNLVTGPYGVSDEAFSASSTHHDCPVENVRIDSNTGWCPATQGDGNYIQVEFQTISVLTAIQTRGRANRDQWVASYSVNVSTNGLTWTSILSNNTVQVFLANNDSNTLATNTLTRIVVAKYIRIISVSGNSFRSMRLEVKGCPVASMCSKWTATLGSSGDVFPVLVHTNAANQGSCGLMCYEQPDCDSFVFNIGSNHCRLLKSTPDVLYTTVDVERVWYFVKLQLP
ncbi:neuropilin-2-like [Argopecten irradians]|uniref:neuropilin-2-like n=1 Tax=Argopecten irradians TaxID=31199 RepID=UPI003721072B